MADPWGEPVEPLPAIGEALDPIPPRLLKILETAEEKGWQMRGPGTTIVTRLTRDDDPQALSFYVAFRWNLVKNSKGESKWSWRFHGAMAGNGQRMNYSDISIYLDDPSVIWPDAPEDE